MVLATRVLHGTLMVLDQMLFGRREFLRANGLIYLLVCTCLLYTLLFCGATDLSVAGWISCCWYYNPASAARPSLAHEDFRATCYHAYSVAPLPERHGKQ
jgi:hypothetical protein